MSFSRTSYRDSHIFYHKAVFSVDGTSSIKLMQLGEGSSHTEVSQKWKPFKHDADFCIIFVTISVSAKTQIGLGIRQHQ